jgi:carboxypeptidase C (cathepsin A)
MMFVFVLLLAFIGLASCAPAADLITNLPGAPANIPFKQYSGYLIANASHNRSIFYWFVQSINDPVNDPVVLWSNGGPGCSGLIGFWTEQGPFRPQSDLTLAFTDYPWNKVANMLFIEAPAGVGFSYSDVPSDYVTGDNQTAFDNYNAILSFLDKFPEYNNNSFYITSESYGGHYMPTLAQTIVDQNKVNPKKINFKGFAVGNPYTDPVSNNYGAMTTFGGHQLVDKPTYDAWVKDCPSDPLRCAEHEAQIELYVRGLNPYALDYPVCNSNAALTRAQRYKFLNHTLPLHRKKIALAAPYDPCVDNYATKYMNRADVQAAIHAKPTTWAECSNKIVYSEQDSLTPMEPIYHYLLAGGYNLNILVYSGDDDSVCATSGSQYWIWPMNYRVLNPWTAWKYVDDDFGSQVGGYVVKFQGLTFATVHGAGHEVPTYKPQAALEVFKKYLADQW